MVKKIKDDARTDRQKKVLDIVIRHYTSTAEPVGSHLVSEQIGLSSATIRHIMFELEEQGLLSQPHISAGRVPTGKGYRVYVDSLMSAEEFLNYANYNADSLKDYLKSTSIEDVVSRGLQLCSRLTSHTCMVLFLNLKLRNYLIDMLEEKIRSILEYLYDFEDRVYLDGTHHLFEYPEFKDFEKISSVLKILEDKKSLMEILEDDLKNDGIKVHIGSENRVSEFCECTLITSNYSLEGKIVGALGIFGPMRMKYEEVIPTVNSITESMSRLLSEIT